MARTRVTLPEELQRLRRSEWEHILTEANLDDESRLIAELYLLHGIPQQMIADSLQEQGIYLSRPTVSRRCREIIDRAQWVWRSMHEEKAFTSP